MNRLWAPWRIEYLVTEKPSGCIFCIGDLAGDRERLILLRSSCCFVMLNRYPYTNGHLMISPYRHTTGIDCLTEDEMLDLMKMTGLCQAVLAEAASPEGFNIGINVGAAAGAGVDDHMHIHVVPRWNGDTNFMTVVSDLRVMPECLQATYERLLPLFTEASGRSR